MTGFRYDAAVNIELDYFEWLVPELGFDVFHFGEIVGTSLEEVTLYTDLMKSTDFRLLIQMTQEFSDTGDIRQLVPARLSDVVPTHARVSFVRNHDADFNPGFFNFQSLQHAALAYIYILNGIEGIPFLYNRDMHIPELQAALQFRKQLDNGAADFSGVEINCLNCERDLLAWTKGNQGLVILNKSKQWQRFDMSSTTLEEGCYREIRYSFDVCFERSGDKVQLSRWSRESIADIGPLTGLMFRKI